MARIIETNAKRRTIKLSVEDIISIVKQYQTVSKGHSEAPIIRDILKSTDFYLPEDI